MMSREQQKRAQNKKKQNANNYYIKTKTKKDQQNDAKLYKLKLMSHFLSTLRREHN